MIRLDRKWIFVIFIFILISSTVKVNAIGISPGRSTFDFEPGLTERVEFSVLNNEHKDMRVVIYVEGALNDTVVLKDVLLNFKSNEESKKSYYEFTLPQKIEEPGTYETRIIAREIPVEGAFEGAFVGATAAVVTQLHINVPYPGKYAKTELKVSETSSSQPTTFIAVVNNFGTQNIVKAEGIIDIYGPTNEKIGSVRTNAAGVASKGRKELVAAWQAPNPGKYFATLTTTYDGEVAKAETTFSVGDQAFDILDVSVKDFQLGGIAKFDILVESKWNDKIDEVYAEMIISDEKGDEVARVKSASESIEAMSKEVLVAFWDTEGVKEGIYSANLIVYYGEKSTQRELRAVVSLNSIEVSFFGATAEAVRLTSSSLNKETMYMIILFVLVGINIAWFVYFKKRSKGRNEVH